MTAILIPIDGNPPSKAALEYVLAEFPEADVTVLHVIGVVDTAGEAERASGHRREQLERARADAEDLFEEVDRRAAEAGVEVATETAFGPPSRTIPNRAEEFDRVVMGEHGQSGARQILLGSVAETVVSRSPVPVTVVRGDSEEPDRRMIVPVDGSPLSREALDYACSEHDPETVTILHVIDPSEPAYSALEAIDVRQEPLHGSEEWYERAETAADELVADVRGEVSAGDVDIGTAVETGDPSQVIADRAAAGGFDHVVMGSHGRTGLDRLLLGSVAETVVHRSPVTVTVVR
ncbi:universal stress protein [Natronomonas halophila]|uniref:universal stress protein n=1 Tax=Natronomonas halophila TaxID=2747817 RepID=UPI001FE6C71D|nr:universal stress protein [Natronomonas halophila]